MVDIATVRRLALAVLGAADRSRDGRLAFEAAGKGFAWTYMRRVSPKKPRIPDLDVLAVRCAIERKEMLIAAAPDRFFDDDHYRGYPAVLVRLAAIGGDELEGLLREGVEFNAQKTRKR
ncbi:MAG: MmcQ/YjbR family DNA-binding protein [Phenylobacterium sp.]|nr:MAG: MmcQ/YjbR family DNA-binding protein [Phenylobacterium sp.]